MIDGPSIEVFDGMTVVGMRRAMSLADFPVGELWRAFRPRVGDVEGRTSDDFISMRIYEEPPGPAPGPGTRFDQWAAVEVVSSADGGSPAGFPEGMEVHRVAGGLYAVFTYRGRAADFGDAARHIYGEWLPGSGYELADREFFEVLGPSYRPDDPDARETIWIPIRERRSKGGER